MNLKKINLRNGKGVIKRLIRPGNSIGEKTIKGGFWVFSLRIVNQLLGLARIIVLARLLSPNDFGLFGIALLALSALDTFSQTGFRQALIQKRKETKSYLNTVWTIGIIRGFLIAIILFLIAPYAALFFGTPGAEPILKVIGLAIILQGFTNVAVIYFEKELKFHKYFAYQFLGTIADVTVAISAAFLLRSVWALIFGLLAGNLVRCIVSYIIDPYRPKLQFNKDQAKELFGFGKWILGSSILIFLIAQGDDIFVGKLLGVAALGFYQMAYRISNMPATEITHVISQVTFPAYSKLQDNIPKLKAAYLKVLQVTVFLSFPMAGLILILAPDFTKIFLGDKWMPMVPAMQVLVLWGAIRSIGVHHGSVLQAVGKPKILTKLNIIKLIILAILIYPLSIKWGIVGTSLAVCISALLITPIALYITINKILKGKMYMIGKIIFIPLVSTFLMVLLLGLFAVKNLSLLGFILTVLAGITFYFATVSIFGKILRQKTWYDLKTVISGVLK